MYFTYNCGIIQIIDKRVELTIVKPALTATTESRAATAKISAQDTTPAHELSRLVLIVSTTSKPLNDPEFVGAVFSPVKFAVSSSKTDASQPCFIYNHIRISSSY